MEHLDSLKEYRKRARCTEDVGLQHATKAVKIDLSLQYLSEEIHMEVDALRVREDPVVYGKPFPSIMSPIIDRCGSKRGANAVLTS